MLKLMVSKSRKSVFIKVISKIIKGTDKDNIFGLMESIILDNGNKEKNLVAAIGNPLLDKTIWASGMMDK